MLLCKIRIWILRPKDVFQERSECPLKKKKKKISIHFNIPCNISRIKIREYKYSLWIYPDTFPLSVSRYIKKNEKKNFVFLNF